MAPGGIHGNNVLQTIKFRARVIRWAEGLLALRPIDRREGEQLYRQFARRKLLVWIEREGMKIGPVVGLMEGKLGHREAVRIIRALEIEKLKQLLGYEVDVYVTLYGEVVDSREAHVGAWTVRVEKLSSGAVDVLAVYRAKVVTTPDTLRGVLENLLNAPKEEIFKELGL